MSSPATSVDSSSGSADVALALRSVKVAYENHVVLDAVDGLVRSGKSLALVGPNGGGKTTLIRAILGLVPLVSGSIEVLGTTPTAARPLVAYVPQADSFDPQFPISALDVALMGRYRKVGWFKRPGKHDREIAMDALKEVGLDGRARTRFGALSGGQQQRVLLARAIAQESRLLLLDEPFNGVDTATTDVVVAVLERLRHGGAAVVMSTHDLSVAHLACTEACLINHHQVGFGPIETTLTADLLRKTYGGSAVILAGDSSVVTTN